MNFNKNPIHVRPSPVIQDPKYITSFNYAIIDFEACKEITFLCISFDDAGSQLTTQTIQISGEDYENWGNDDNYIVNYLCKKMGLNSIVNSSIFKKIYAMDTSGNPVDAYYLKKDANGTILLPDEFFKDASNVLNNSKNKPISFSHLQYDFEGRAVIVNPFVLDSNNNPIIPDDYIIDTDRNIRHPSGIHVVIAS